MGIGATASCPLGQPGTARRAQPRVGPLEAERPRRKSRARPGGSHSAGWTLSPPRANGADGASS